MIKSAVQIWTKLPVEFRQILLTSLTMWNGWMLFAPRFGWESVGLHVWFGLLLFLDASITIVKGVLVEIAKGGGLKK